MINDHSSRQTQARQTEASQTEASQTEARQTEVRQIEAMTTQTGQPSAGLAPMGVTLALAVIAFCGSLAVFIPLPAAERPWPTVVIMAVIHTVGMPTLFWLMAQGMNRFLGERIASRNALTLGWLLSVVWLLVKMGQYS